MRVIDYYVREDEAEVVLEVARGRGLQTVRSAAEGDLHHVRVAVPYGAPDEVIEEIDERIDFDADPATFYVLSEALTIRPRAEQEGGTDRSAARDEIEALGEEGARAGRMFWVLAVTAGVLASSGLLLDNSAVIVGAMVIAPLYAPITGVAGGIILGRGRTALRAAGVAMLALTVALACGLACGVLTPGVEVTEALTARGSVTFYSVAVALAAGTAAGYTVLRNDRVLVVGIVVAASLVPQSAAAGVFLGIREWGLAAGAVLGLATNVVGIALAIVAVCRWEHLRPERREQTPEQRRLVRRSAWGLGGAMAVLAGVTVWLSSVDFASVALTRRASAVREALAQVPGVLGTAYMTDGDTLVVFADEGADPSGEVARVLEAEVGRRVRVVVVATEGVWEANRE